MPPFLTSHRAARRRLPFHQSDTSSFRLANRLKSYSTTTHTMWRHAPRLTASPITRRRCMHSLHLMSTSGSEGRSGERKDHVPDNRLVDYDPSDRPDELDGEKGAQDLHPVIAKAVLGGGLPPRHPDCKERDGKTCTGESEVYICCHARLGHDFLMHGWAAASHFLVKQQTL
jgi:hypothetical protein